MTEKSTKQIDMSDIETDLLLEVTPTSASRLGITHQPTDEDRARFQKMELILEVGGEGGGITLYGANTGTGWVFCLAVVDQSLLLTGEDRAIQHISKFVHGLEDALALMDHYPWPQLTPLFVHPDFRIEMLRVVSKRLGKNRDKRACLERWMQLT
jgi:hypothetical protein